MTRKTISAFCCSLLVSALLLPAVSARAGSVPKHEHHDDPKANARVMVHARPTIFPLPGTPLDE